VHAILDAGFVCHVGYAIDGQPYVTPTTTGGTRTVYWHGSSASRMLRNIAGGIPVCFTVTHIDASSWRAPASTTRSTTAR
jgi:hypothetical protein